MNQNKPISKKLPSAELNPLKASAGSLNKTSNVKKIPPLVNYFSSNDKPGLGSNFFAFEKEYGLPKSTETDDPKWTWANFSTSAPKLELFAASKGLTGLVDILVVEIPSYQVHSDADLIFAIKSLAGGLKNQNLGPVKKSVTYIPEGRREISKCVGQTYKACWLSPRGISPDKNTYILIVSKTQDDIEKLLSVQTANIKMLSFIKNLFNQN